MTAAAEAELATIDDVADAKAAVLDLAKRLGPGGADAAGASRHVDAGPAVPATPGTAERGAAATTEAATEATPATGPATVGHPRRRPTTILAELDALIGLAAVKAAVRRLLAVHLLNAERRGRRLSPRSTRASTSSSPAIPGTGKTTVARIIARLYGSIGLVSRGHLVEVSRADLVAGYVGQTALKVQAVVDRAIGGVAVHRRGVLARRRKAPASSGPRRSPCWSS